MRRSPAVTVGLLAVSASLVALPAVATTGSVEVGGNVWLDLDGDGVRDDGDPGRAGVPVTLRTTTTVVEATVSGADGSWTLVDVAPGSYTLVLEPPLDLRVTTGQRVVGSVVEIPLSVPGDGQDVAVGLGTPVTSGPDVAVDVTADGTDGTDEAAWTVALHNLGPDDAAPPLEVRIVLGSGHEFSEITGDDWSCDLATSIATCSSATGAAAASSLPPISVTTLATGSIGSTISLSATGRLDGAFDDAPLNDEDEATTTVGAESAAVDDADGDGDGDAMSAAGTTTAPTLLAAVLALFVGVAGVRGSRRV